MKHIPLTQGKFAVVDDADYEWLNQWKWYALKSRNTYYACRRIGSKKIYLHRIIMDTPPGMEADHRDHNGLNCVRTNMRNCTHAENLRNQLSGKGGTSKYKGVYWHWAARKWMARICHNGRLIYLGYYESEEAAARAYNKKAEELFGEFACLNIVERNIA